MRMFTSEEFNKLIDEGLEITPLSDIMVDVVNGRLWKDLKAKGYFQSRYDIVLMLNRACSYPRTVPHILPYETLQHFSTPSDTLYNVLHFSLAEALMHPFNVVGNTRAKG